MSNERRKHPRYCVTRPIDMFPALEGGIPDRRGRSDGLLVDVSGGGLALEVPVPGDFTGTRLVVGIETAAAETRFATVEVRHAVPVPGGVRLGVQFASHRHDLLADDCLLPKLDAETYRFETGLPAEVLAEWVRLGVLQPVVVDRAFVCPHCHALATGRSGCPVCGSGRLESRRLIHHYACAYVGYPEEFERDAEMICPKCHTRRLVVGADFEHLQGPSRCLDCPWSGTQLGQVGHCLRCGLRFPFEQAYEESLIGYRVRRFDPQALIDQFAAPRCLGIREVPVEPRSGTDPPEGRNQSCSAPGSTG